MTPAPVHTLAARAVVLACVLAALPGCTLIGRKIRECDGFDVPLSVFVGPARKELRTRVVSAGVDETFPFVAESNAEQMVIVGFTPLGTKSFTLTRKADDVDVDNVLGAALRVSPRNVMADVLAMSLPSACATAPDGDAPANFDSWRVTDTCSNNLPTKRTITRAAARAGETPAVEVEIEYRPEAIIVRQKQCKYTAAYVLHASQPIPGIDVKKTGDEKEAVTTPATAAPAPGAAPAPVAPSSATPPAGQQAPVPPAATPAPATPAPAMPSPATPEAPASPSVTPPPAAPQPVQPARPAAPPAPAKPPILAPSPAGSPILVPAN